MSDTLIPREPRVTVNREFATAEEFIDQYVANVSTSGVFVRCDDELEIGTYVNLNFSIVDEEIETIEGVGEVVRIQANPKGVGVEFRSLTEASMKVIEGLIAAREGEGL